MNTTQRNSEQMNANSISSASANTDEQAIERRAASFAHQIAEPVDARAYRAAYDVAYRAIREGIAIGIARERAKRKRLEAAGWRVGSAEEFLATAPPDDLVARLRDPYRLERDFFDRAQLLDEAAARIEADAREIARLRDRLTFDEASVAVAAARRREQELRELVRQEYIEETGSEPEGSVAYKCHLCGREWVDRPEDHAPDCLARKPE